MIGNFLRKSDSTKPQPAKVIPPEPLGSPPAAPSLENPLSVKEIKEKEEYRQKEKDKEALVQKPALISEQKKDFNEEQTKEKDRQQNIVALESKLFGSLAFQNQLILNGCFEGEIFSKEGTLIIGQKAIVKANIEVGNILVFGHFSGNINATHLTELKAGSEVLGDVKTRKLKVEEGAMLIGKCECIAQS
ncbi:polymer-forming cytoskeletal protein [Methylacidiphilum caldifontis]|uniref:bactofilin family protein n=1 Tax=Methylacidiphilum caldifontis TaxID=2795386 RepID=UPI001A8FE31E|nr:polymer-forming cytoskeletal protein [Methylacidiphilum caldifontis]QSR89023.1 polymer-forming cytoskeletal protein [Methylacidiphilum caldifontis]